MLRIISGKYRHQIIEQPPKEITRATKDKIREAIFSSIRYDLEEAIFLDLCAGSGAFGLEAISNGAMKAIFVENDYRAVKIIKNNCSKLGANNIEINNIDVLNYLKNKEGCKYDFIFFDPPYKDKNLYFEVIKLISKGKLLAKNGLLVVEHEAELILETPENLTIQKQKKYGEILVSFIANNN
ncbi:16S rRNA (guanine(966)-N(2))-methyltransferase RsmD [Mycoplasmopsis opalescens]|uniref:16S rRNA (guanine(966)-N(2))-methyltransferase RsmD n=1 Tax=Mycoplasmopsis opalescens TaxID=114886 RepID=UPI0004A6B390|nr:16S rRNA (guanine(966)-N(2))-methyltransferase RsmD [Mycoplasmopsis opalescens]